MKRKQLRLKGYDYSHEGAYFVTICVHNRVCLFGKIEDGGMQLSLIGEKVKKYWNLIPQVYSNVSLDHYVIMPNHLHGIIVINDMDVGAVINRPNNERAIDNRPYGKLSQIIKSFKQMVTKEIRKENVYFQWQRSFYDHVIRNEIELKHVREYIIHNPQQWELDGDNPLSTKSPTEG